MHSQENKEPEKKGTLATESGVTEINCDPHEKRAEPGARLSGPGSGWSFTSIISPPLLNVQPSQPSHLGVHLNRPPKGG
ncbi:hypothetical protein, partial [Streptomyces sp. MBT97]|uniref:hypothetical protein n=1 Tax=Streptomyces sp. MBT97 TaxID=2800411 RepID=UPI001F3DC2D1